MKKAQTEKKTAAKSSVKKTPAKSAAKKAAVKEAKAAAKEKAVENYKDLTAYITISFANADEKRVFCQLAGIDESERFVQGEQVLNLIE